MTTSVPEDTYLSMIPFTLTHALIGELDPGDGWKKLLMAVESSQDDGLPLDPDFKAHLELCHRRMESPTEKLLSDLGQKGYRLYHLRKWLNAQRLQRAVDLLEGGDKTTGRVSVQRTQSASSETWMYKPPEYRHSQSVEERGRGKTVEIPRDQLTTSGDHAEVGIGGGGGGGTIVLGSDVVVDFDSTRKPEVGASTSEGACVVPNRSEGSGVSESPSGPKGADDIDGQSESERADMERRLDRSEVTNAKEGRREPESTDRFDRPSKPDDANVVKESKKLEGAVAVSGPNYESISRVNPSHLNSKPATFRMRTEVGTDSVSPPEDDAPFERDGGPYHQHRLVGSETVWHQREITASGGGDGSRPKEEVTHRTHTVPEDTYLNMIPYTLTHALMGDLDASDGWKKLLMAVESSQDDGPPLDPGFKAQLELCHRRMESPTEKLLSDLGQKGYRLHHLRKWLRAQRLLRAAILLEGGDKATGHVSVQRTQSASSETWMYEPPEYRHSQSAANPLHPPSPAQTAVPPPPPPCGVAAAGPLLTTDRRTSRSLEITHPADITEALDHQIDAHWNHFGNSLRFHPTLMGTIKADNRDCADCMLDLVTKWVSRDDGTGDLPRTWETVVKAVKASGHKQLAEELAKKFGVSITW